MEKYKSGGPAFPSMPKDPDGPRPFHGMSLRDWYKGKALEGLLRTFDDRHPDAIAKAAGEIADAMIAEES